VPTSISKIIEENSAQIIGRFEVEARRSMVGKGLTRLELVNHLPNYLSSLVQRVSGPTTQQASDQKWLVDSQVASRLRQGFILHEIIDEFVILGRCIAETWSSSPEELRPSAVEVDRLHQELHVATAGAVAIFTEHLIEDQQAEKRFLRRLQKVATESLGESAVTPLRGRLHDTLELISEAMRADGAGLFLYEPERRQLVLAASTTGLVNNPPEQYVTPLDSTSFAARVATSQETLYIPDAATTGLDIGDLLRRGELHSLLGLPLLPRDKLFGILYVGVKEVRTFESSEVRMFESLGERLGLLLDNARLHETLGTMNQELRTERELRERFVSVLAHDLLGPLAAAKMGTQFLLDHPELHDHRRTVTARIIHDIEQTDRMVRDLLDVHQIRAGHRLTLRLTKTDLVAVARDVVQELTLLHGERFAIRAPEHLWGMWSTRDLRRAVWNLATNGIKYGGPETPVVLEISGTSQGAVVAIHNDGPSISPEDLATLFNPFSRTPTAQAGALRGWGLGLTLVRGCVEAHGGTVEVVSEPCTGTTFTMRFPPDARPFQPRSESAPPL
jgi:signal transduction histidine kinase